MRLKLVLLTSLLGAVLGAGVPIAFFAVTVGWLAFFPPRFAYQTYGWQSLMVNLPPLLGSVLAAIFAYRHTARRRRLQAVLTGILVLLFSVIAYVVAFLIVPIR